MDVPAAPASVGTAVRSDVPVLLLAGGLDPFTPPTWASMRCRGAVEIPARRGPDRRPRRHDLEPDCATLLMHDFLGSPGDQLDRSCLGVLDDSCVHHGLVPRRTPFGPSVAAGQLGADVLVFEKLRAQKNV